MVFSTHEHRDYLRRSKFAQPVRRAVEREWSGRFRCEELREGPGGSLRSLGQSKEELVVVLEGEVECEVDGRACRVAPGDELYVPESTPFACTNVGSTYARILLGYA
jgi:mannose-6-phosphate isomerase-like protein (cupin superfamily)